MQFEDKQNQLMRSHTLKLENRARMELTGVKDVSGFDENTVILSTDMGDITVRGQSLHIEKIDLDAGTVELKGKVNEFSYDEPAEHGSFWTRLFG